MKKQIWKFELEGNTKTILMPKHAEILCVQNQNETPCIWAYVHPGNEKEERQFEIYGTVHDIHYDMGIEREYIGTFQLSNGALVFHLFERIN